MVPDMLNQKYGFEVSEQASEYMVELLHMNTTSDAPEANYRESLVLFLDILKEFDNEVSVVCTWMLPSAVRTPGSAPSVLISLRRAPS